MKTRTIMQRHTIDHPVRIASDVTLDGDLAVPEGAMGLVVFAHGSGSSRHNTRNLAVAHSLQRKGFATLLLDLLTREEERIDEQTREYGFEVDLLARRVVTATDWAESNPDLHHLPLGYFGASTGAAAALIAAAERPDDVRAIVSRGGRPDLAGDALPRVTAPTLLIVGGNDGEVIDLNRDAMHRIRTTIELEIVPGATHLFEEPGALERVSALAVEWFDKHLAAATV
jgi:putative phosphoribosyl transferase